MNEDNPTDSTDEKEITAQILELIYKGDHDAALLLAKQLREKHLSPVAYAKILMILDKALAEKLRELSKLVDTES